MKHILVIILLFPFAIHAQSYNDSILKHRQHYKQEFITEERSPLKGKDTAFLRFYEPDARYRVSAVITLADSAKPFEMPTYSGKTKTFKQYGTLHFKLLDRVYMLQVFQNVKLLDDTAHKDHLFVPFTDMTTYEETYGGGRYIDLSTKDIKGNRIEVDFNKCYNPYCAYAGGYNCPIPPPENRLPVAVRAGEKLYGKQHK